MRLFIFFFGAAFSAAPAEFHVAVSGSDAGDGSPGRPFRTISAAARIAQPGDTITVHAGVYRERIDPPRGGISDSLRIIYQAAAGEEVHIKGSEIVKGWQRFTGNVWKLTLPNSYFGAYNPYTDLIRGDWFTDKGRPHHTGEVYLNGRALYETHLLERVLNPKPYKDSRRPEDALLAWFTENDGDNTYIYANFGGADPNSSLVEIHVREAVFYPAEPNRDYITVRGFRMSHAATQWAAPTAEQIGLIGTHWSKGWIIENNVISNSKCSGITLGKDRATGHNVWTLDPRKDGATHYNEVIFRALNAGWSRETIGSHIVRNNVISDCEQTGICGSLGPVFSLIENNHIYNIWAKRQFTGAEMAGIKLHAAIGVTIRKNRIHNAGRGLWMDWMAQGTRITGNLLYDNTTDDLFVEVNHGPFVVDNNLFLSPLSLQDWSQGGAYAHNLFAGRILSRPELRRFTPYHRPHSTMVAGRSNIKGGDSRFHNNLFLKGAEADLLPKTPEDRASGYGLWVYDTREFPLETGGNVYLDPRYPAVIEYVRRLLLRLVRDYGLDGLKIDFVDGVASKIEPHMAPLPLGAEGGPALQELLGSVMDLLRRDKPDLMIECRQGYSNFAARRWANCYRSPDVPINFHQNRFNCAMLRLLLPDRAVFFDPALWPMDDPDENVGRHMISAISAVPMISIEFDRYPKSHLEIVRHWIGFYHQHRPTLVRGGFEPLIELGHNPQTVFRGRDETIVGLYADRPLVLEHPGHRLYILNGSTRPWIDVVPAGAAATRTVQVFTATGQDVGRAEIQFPCWRVDVPVGGYAAVT